MRLFVNYYLAKEEATSTKPAITAVVDGKSPLTTAFRVRLFLSDTVSRSILDSTSKISRKEKEALETKMKLESRSA